MKEQNERETVFVDASILEGAILLLLQAEEFTYERDGHDMSARVLHGYSETGIQIFREEVELESNKKRYLLIDEPRGSPVVKGLIIENDKVISTEGLGGGLDKEGAEDFMKDFVVRFSECNKYRRVNLLK